MKRIAIRLSALTGVIVLGWIAIAQAQRLFDNGTPAAAATTPDDTSQSASNRPTELTPAPIGGAVDAAPREIPQPFAGGGSLADRTGANSLRSDRRFTPETESSKSWNDGPTPAADQFGSSRRELTPPPAAAPDDGFSPRLADRQPADNQLAQASPITPPPTDGPANLPNDSSYRPAAAQPRALPNFRDARPIAAPQGGQFAKAKPLAARAVTGARPASEGKGRPGSKDLEGTRTATLTMHKFAPEEIQVGKAVTFEISVRNTGAVAAEDVEIHDVVPKGTRLVSTTPRAQNGPGGALVWKIGRLGAGDQLKLQIQLMPTTEGEIGSVASLRYRTDASVRTIATKPNVSVQVSTPRKVMIGDDITLKIKITNSGTGTAENMVLEQAVPAALKHPAGPDLEFDLGDLAPGESRDVELVMTAAEAGQVVNRVIARGEGSATAEQSAAFEIVAPALEVAIKGPNRRYLDRKATYTVSVNNPGTAAAKDIELVTHLPRGMKFIKANNAGEYNEATHSVHWSLAELPPNERGDVSVTALPISSGDQKIEVKGKAEMGLTTATQQTTKVEGVAAILFEVLDVNDPIEVGGETTYEIRVVNQGSKAATNVVVTAVLPPELKPVAADGPTRNSVSHQRVVFQPLTRLAPKADTTYRIRAKGIAVGDLRIRVQLQSDEMRTPVTKEESTRVYTDE